MKKIIVASIAAILLSVTVVVLICISNDHSECFKVQKVQTLNNGKTIVTTNNHICKEKFNL
ncbi:hypothetical protein [Psychroserpens sp. Hel_I_66]|uniref:hypothetical protein n=1 Tax=Psychroserpens sp. Hel_I_66 TaxID=1250004 RepID=UPI000645CB32|nr:hypothetical protein [Psychroserpens sp. Hel_I_66]